MNRHVRCNIVALAAVSAAAAASCASMQVTTDRDPRADFAAYQTFDVKRGDVLVNGVADSRDTLVRERIEVALEQELGQSGLQRTKQGPDLIATYTAGGRSVREDGDDWDGAYGGLDHDVPREYTEGRLLIDLIDPKANKLVWRAVVEMESEDQLRSAENLRKAVDKAFEKYPGRLGAS